MKTGFFKPNVEKMEKNKDVDGLIKALKHKDMDVQRKAADSLGKIGTPAVEPLIQALKDEEIYNIPGSAIVRGKVTEALKKMKVTEFSR